MRVLQQSKQIELGPSWKWSIIDAFFDINTVNAHENLCSWADQVVVDMSHKNFVMSVHQKNSSFQWYWLKSSQTIAYRDRKSVV